MILEFDIQDAHLTLEEAASKEYTITAAHKGNQYSGSGVNKCGRFTLYELITDEDTDLYIEHSHGGLEVRIEHPFFDISFTIKLKKIDPIHELKLSIHFLSAELAESKERIQALSAELAESKERIQALSAELAESKERICQALPKDPVMVIWSGTTFRVSDPKLHAIIKQTIINKEFLNKAAPDKLTDVMLEEFNKRNSIEYVCNSLGIKLHLAPFLRHVMSVLQNWLIESLYFNGSGSPVSIHVNKEFNSSGNSSWRMKLIRSAAPLTHFRLEEWSPHSVSNLDERSIVFDYLAPYGAFYTGMVVQR